MVSSYRINQIVGRMSSYCPWYIAWLGPLEKSKEIEWKQIPLMTASVLEQHYYSSDNPLIKLSGLYEYRTSGTSSGRRKSIYYSKADEESYMRIKLGVFRTVLGSSGYRKALADMGTGHAEATAIDVFRQLGFEVDSIPFTLPIEGHLARLQHFKPEVLYTMPSILERILMRSERPELYGIKHVILVGEMAPRGWIRQVADRLGIAEDQITDTYGSIEIGTLAYYSPECGRYLFADGLIAEGVGTEVLEDELDPLPDDEQVLVLTSVVREAFPAIRYVTYDVVRDLRPILVDGVERMSFQSIVKRIGPDLKHGEKISVYDIENVVNQHLGQMSSVRVHVEGNRLKVIVYIPQDDESVYLATTHSSSEEALEALRQALEERIPAIGNMIHSGILGHIQVVRGSFDDDEQRSRIKHKKIYYDKVEGS